MPLGNGNAGTDAEGAPSEEFCKYCYSGGAFTEPDITMDQMITKSVHYMVASLKMSDETAEHLAKNIIPTLKRWHGLGLAGKQESSIAG